MQYLALIPAEGGTPVLLAPDLDRRVFNPKFSKDGTTILFGMMDRGERQLASIPFSGGEITRIVNQKVALSDYTPGKSLLYTLQGTATTSPEIFSWSAGDSQKLSAVNDSVMERVRMGTVEKVTFESKDSTPIEGFVIKPPGFDPAKKYPLILLKN